MLAMKTGVRPRFAQWALQVFVLSGLLLPFSPLIATGGATSRTASAVRNREVEERQLPQRRHLRLMTRSHAGQTQTAVSESISIGNCSDEPCEPVCGDGRCDPDEECVCQFDCPSCNTAVCGDGLCQSGTETTQNCPADCHTLPTCTPSCTAGLCGPDGCGGTCTCGFGDICTNGVCGACVSECGGAVACGRDRCGNQCGACPSGYACSGGQCIFAPSCGDRTCSAGENCSNCPGDCGDCCGNGRLDGSEACDGTVNCPTYATCNSCNECIYPVQCGDGHCVATESSPSSPTYCPSDCGGGGGGGGGGGATGCDADHDGMVTEVECTGACGGQIQENYCVLP